jgi:transcription antitermination factor NusG
MTKTILAVCVTVPGAEERAQRSIEHNGFGTRTLTYRSNFYRLGKRQVLRRPLFPGYVFPELGDGWGMITGTEGVQLVLMSNGKPMGIVGKDAERLANLELRCLMGEFSKRLYRSAANDA